MYKTRAIDEMGNKKVELKKNHMVQVPLSKSRPLSVAIYL